MSAALPLAPEQRQLRQTLRLNLRARRRGLAPPQQAEAARQLARRLRAALPHRQSRVAAYVACDGEIDPASFLSALGREVALFYPVLSALAPAGVRFAQAGLAPRRHAPHSHGWRRNRYGIPEPQASRCRPAWTLSLLLLPLVGFDRQGRRLGMGGGFYDRVLADLRRRPRRPRLVGIAHACQEVGMLPAAVWDQAVDMVVTDREIIRAG